MKKLILLTLVGMLAACSGMGMRSSGESGATSGTPEGSGVSGMGQTQGGGPASEGFHSYID